MKSNLKNRKGQTLNTQEVNFNPNLKLTRFYQNFTIFFTANLPLSSRLFYNWLKVGCEN